MRILITGGFGFVGGRLGQYLHNAGHQVVLGSRAASSPPDWLPQAKVVYTDWNNGCTLEQICNGVDVVIHAAGMNAQDCVANPIAALECNGLATARIVDAASRAGVKRFIYLSTAHVYASPLVGVVTEENCPRNLHPYAASHLAGENALMGFSQRGQIEGVVLRLSNAFGAPVHKDVNCWQLLVNDLCRQAIETQKMVLHSSGLQQRDFVAMTGVCHVIECLSSRDFDSAALGVVNLGSGVSQSVFEMVQLVRQRCEVVLGFAPQIQRPVGSTDKKYEALEFRTDKLAVMGLEVVVDSNIEIDGLLTFCHASFNKDYRKNA